MSNHQHATHPALPKMAKRQLGAILVDGGFISPHDLDTAVERQKTTNDQLGEILVGMGVLHSIELKAVLAVQKDLASPDTAVTLGAGIHMPLGELLIKAQRINRKQLDLVLQEQKLRGEKLGAVLVNKGLLLKQELLTVLAFQKNLQRRLPESEKLWLDELLVATGQITREQLAEVLECRKRSQKKIEELLVEEGHLKPEQIDHHRKIQQKLVTAAVIAALSSAGFAGTASEAHAFTPALSVNISIQAVVREHTSMDILSQPGELIISNADITRGFIDMPAASRISVKSNNPAGYLLTFENMNSLESLFSSVQVNVGGKDVRLSASAGWIPLPYVKGVAALVISYHFMLSKDVLPGTYIWPFMVSVSPM